MSCSPRGSTVRAGPPAPPPSPDGGPGTGHQDGASAESPAAANRRVERGRAAGPLRPGRRCGRPGHPRRPHRRVHFPPVPDDIASRILAGFKRGELPGWMSRTSHNSAVLKIGLADGETVSITAPSQRLAEARESSNDAVLEILMKRADGEDVADATLDEARARTSRAATDYLAGVITEFGPAIRFEPFSVPPAFPGRLPSCHVRAGNPAAGGPGGSGALPTEISGADRFLPVGPGSLRAVRSGPRGVL